MPYTTEFDLVRFDARSATMYVRVRTLDGIIVIDTREDVPVRLPVDSSGLVPVGAELTEIITSAVARSFSTAALAETERLARITDAGGAVTNAATIYALTEETEPESVAPLLGYGITSILASMPGYFEFFSGVLPADHTISPELASADYIAVSVGWQYTNPAGPGGNVELTPSQYTISGTTLTITASAESLGIDTGRDPAVYVNIVGDEQYNVNETYNIILPASPIQVSGPGSFRPHLTGEPAPGSGGTPASFAFTYDGSGFIDSITITDPGLGYDNTSPVQFMLFYTQYNPADILTISSTIDFEYQDENSIFGRIGGLNVIGTFYDWRNNTDPAEGGNGGPYGWGGADDTPITATWTDGSRSISLTYQRTLASITPSPPPYSSNLNYWYSFIVLDPILDFTVTGDWTSADFIPVVGVNPPEQDPRIIFEIDYDNPTVINLVTPPSTGVRSGADQHHLQIELYNDGSAYYVDPSESLFVRIGGIT